MPHQGDTRPVPCVGLAFEFDAKHTKMPLVFLRVNRTTVCRSLTCVGTLAVSHAFPIYPEELLKEFLFCTFLYFQPSLLGAMVECKPCVLAADSCLLNGERHKGHTEDTDC